MILNRAKHILFPALGFVFLLASACDKLADTNAPSDPTKIHANAVSADAQAPIASARASSGEVANKPTSPSASLRSISDTFAAAILDGKLKPQPSNISVKTALGLACTPETLPSMTTTLNMRLPSEEQSRANVFAVLTPARGAYAIYYPYDLEEPAEDYIIPSDQINWQSASSSRDFSIKPQLFDGMKIGSQERLQIFQENGLYQFALLRKVQQENAGEIRSGNNVLAVCVVDYQGS